jgi:small subunit ribosomal protein S20
MAHSLSAKKRIRQNEKAHARNKWRLRTMREAVKTFRDKLAHGSVEEAAKAMQECAKIVDRTAAKGVIHKNQAARRKSRMSAALKARKSGGAAATAKS